MSSQNQFYRSPLFYMGDKYKLLPEIKEHFPKNINSKYIAVSYNNTYKSKSSSSKNKITLEQILSTMKKKGKTKIFKKSHNYFNAGKTDFDNHYEYLFITKI